MDEISEVEESYFKSINQIRNDCYRLAWSMRGALNIDQAYMLSYDERIAVMKVIEDNADITKKSGLPYF